MSNGKRIKYKYGITAADRQAIFAAQGHQCWICRTLTDLVLDHHHESGRIRGGLCNPCNVRLRVIEYAEDPAATASLLDPANSDRIIDHLNRDALLELANLRAPNA